jgi:hypothetical protein
MNSLVPVTERKEATLAQSAQRLYDSEVRKKLTKKLNTIFTQ